MMSKNLAIQYLDSYGGDLEEWDGWCMRLARAVVAFVEGRNAEMLTITSPNGVLLYKSEKNENVLWTFHTVPVISGLVHDAWHPNLVFPPQEFIEKAFSDQCIIAKMQASNKKIVYKYP